MKQLEKEEGKKYCNTNFGPEESQDQYHR